MAPDAELAAEAEELARSSAFSGVLGVDRGAEVVVRAAHGMADRRLGVPLVPGSMLGIASGTKTVTAMVVLRLVEEGCLALGTRVRDLLGDDLPLVDDGVTVEHLLGHRSGIGDYLDEDLYDDIADFELPVAAQRLATTAAYLEVLDGHPQRTPPDAEFRYNNGGYVLLAVVAERASGESFYDLVGSRVCAPARMRSTGFLRSDELPPDAALGYLEAHGLRTNVFHLPVRGSGDGGLFTTVDDVAALWRCFLAGGIVAPEVVDTMLAPRREPAGDQLEHGLGVWLARDAPVVEMHGYDAGVSFRSVHHRATGTTCTVIANTGDGAWALYDVQDRWVRS